MSKDEFYDSMGYTALSMGAVKQISLHEQEIERRQKLINNLIGKAEKEQEYIFLNELIEGDVIYFELAFLARDGLTYSKYYKYVALKCQNLWYSTGPKAPKGYTNEEMIRWWTSNDVQNIHIALEWEQV